MERQDKCLVAPKAKFFFSFGCVAYFEVLFPFLTVLLQNVLGCTHKATTSTVRDITQEKKDWRERLVSGGMGEGGVC
jgi:hypothetical protein